MKMSDSFLLIFLKMAILSLRRHLIRSSLAVLGIVIGIASMTVIMAIGEGANDRLKQEILSMGENWIYIIPGNFLNQGSAKKTRKKERKLCYADYLTMCHLLTDIQACTPCLESKQEVKYQNQQFIAEIQGVNSKFFRFESRGIKQGMAFNYYHDFSSIPVAVLGSDASKELFKKENPIGQTILIGNLFFKVIGVFNEVPKQINQFRNPNLNITIPFSTMWKKMVPAENDLIDSIIVRPLNHKSSSQIVANIRRLLRFNHHLSSDQLDDFTIWDFQAMMQAAQRSTQVFNQFLLIAAGVSLFVGGIGVMNMMLIAMTERKKEIGIKMALGATKTHILSQFLIESVFLCLGGGILGILCGLGMTYLLGYFTHFEWVIRQKPLIIALLSTFGIGLFFGFYPAYQASKLNPIDALQSV